MEAVLVLHLTLLISTAAISKIKVSSVFCVTCIKLGSLGKRKYNQCIIFFCPLQVVFNSRSSAVKQMGT